MMKRNLEKSHKDKGGNCAENDKIKIDPLA